MQFLLLSVLVFQAYSKVYFFEESDEGFENRWVYSKDTSVTHGEFHRVKKSYGTDDDYCLKAVNDSSYYHMSSKFAEPLDTAAKNLYFHYVAHYVQDIDCGGAYIKLFAELDQSKLTGTSSYAIMFGLDKCGYETQKVHLIISHKGTNYEIKDKISASIDSLPHLLELDLLTDGTFAVRVDGEKKVSGSLEENFNYLPPKVIDDPEDKKPEDWVDEDTIDDPEDKKPEDWDDRAHIPDPEAKKPEDWDDQNDGEWEPDMKANPDFKGSWAPKKIPNPAYKGVWKAKQIDNPAYRADNTFGRFKLSYAGFDLWTVKSGTAFDKIMVSDDAEEAKKHAATTLEKVKAEAALIKKAKEEEASKYSKDAEDGPEDEEDVPDEETEPTDIPEGPKSPEDEHEDL